MFHQNRSDRFLVKSEQIKCYSQTGMYMKRQEIYNRKNYLYINVPRVVCITLR